MWVLYAVLVVGAGVAFGFGVIPVGIILVALLLLAIAGSAAGGLRSRRIQQTEAPTGIPGTREAAAESRVDPNRTPTGSTTGTP